MNAIGQVFEHPYHQELTSEHISEKEENILELSSSHLFPSPADPHYAPPIYVLDDSKFPLLHGGLDLMYETSLPIKTSTITQCLVNVLTFRLVIFLQSWSNMVAMPTLAQSDANCRLSAHLCSSISTIVLNSLCAWDICNSYSYFHWPEVMWLELNIYNSTHSLHTHSEDRLCAARTNISSITFDPMLSHSDFIKMSSLKKKRQNISIKY